MKQENYIALIEGGQAEVIEKKSRFIANVFAVETEEEAYQMIEKVKKEHYAARHNCYAFSVDAQNPLLRFSDDGEPQGTAGKPILEVIVGSQIRNICIIVTRYFGGTLLGTGGLVRAYTEAAKLGIEASTVREKRNVVIMKIVSNYTDAGKIQYILGQEDTSMDPIEYSDVVSIVVRILKEESDRIMRLVTEITSARAVLEKLGEEFY